MLAGGRSRMKKSGVQGRGAGVKGGGQTRKRKHGT